MDRLADLFWWLIDVRLRRGPGSRILLTRMVGLTLCAGVFTVWMVWGDPVTTYRDVTALALTGASKAMTDPMASTLAQAAGAFAGFTITIAVLLMTLADQAAYVSRASLFRFGSQNLTDDQREIVEETVFFVRDMASAMLSVAFFGFVVAVLGFSLAMGRADAAAAGVSYLFALCSFYIALLLFFGSLVPLFRLVGFRLPVPYARFLFAAATLVGALWLVATARSLTGADYSLGIRTTLFTGAILIIPQWAASAFSHLGVRRRSFPKLGLWYSAGFIVVLAALQILTPRVVPVGTGVWPSALYAASALSISLAIGWSMLLGSLDPDSQPAPFPSIAVLALSRRLKGTTEESFGISICGFTCGSPDCATECSAALCLEWTRDDNPLPSKGLGSYLAVYRALAYALSHSKGEVICLVNSPRLAARLSRVTEGDIVPGTSGKRLMVLKSIQSLTSRFASVRFVSVDEKCPRFADLLDSLTSNNCGLD